MAKTIYWIDDSVQKLEYIMQGIVTELWNVCAEDENDKVVSKILLFGNEYQGGGEETSNNIKKEYELQKRLDINLRYACCQNEEITWGRETYKNNRYLIKDCVKVLFKQWTDQEADLFSVDKKDKEYQKRQQELCFLEEIKEYWAPENRDVIEAETWKREASDKVKKLIDMMEIEKGACVGIDLALLKKDREYLLFNKPVIAMELYHQLKTKFFCFLYSTYTYEGHLVTRCKEIYNNYFEEDCRIYRRDEMMAKKNHDNITREIREA